MKYAGALELAAPSDVEIVVARRFAAARELVFDALTRAELLARWLAPEGWELPLCEVDLRVGGSWRIVTCDAAGNELAMRGTYREIGRPAWLVYTESFDLEYVGESLVTLCLLHVDGETRLTRDVRYPSREIRDEVLESSYRRKTTAAFDRLAELVESLRAPVAARTPRDQPRPGPHLPHPGAISSDLGSADLVAELDEPRWPRPG